MSNARVAIIYIIDKVANTYNTKEGRIVKKRKPEYVNKIVAILPIIYKKK